MNALNLIATLAELVSNHGDLEIWIAGTEWADLPARNVKFGAVHTIDTELEKHNGKPVFTIDINTP